MRHLAMDVASWWITWVLFGLIAWGGLAVLLVWAVHRFHCWQARKPDQAIDALASSVQCTWCRPAPRGLCSCAARCGHVRCVHVPGRGWTARDRKILEGKKLP